MDEGIELERLLSRDRRPPSPSPATASSTKSTPPVLPSRSRPNLRARGEPSLLLPFSRASLSSLARRRSAADHRRAAAPARPACPRPGRLSGRGLSGPCPAIWAGPVAGASRCVARPCPRPDRPRGRGLSGWGPAIMAGLHPAWPASLVFPLFFLELKQNQIISNYLNIAPKIANKISKCSVKQNLPVGTIVMIF